MTPEERKAERAARLEEARKKREEFKNNLFKRLHIEDNPKRELLFAHAWELGHSSGYDEVENYAYDLVDLIA